MRKNKDVLRSGILLQIFNRIYYMIFSGKIPFQYLGRASKYPESAKRLPGMDHMPFIFSFLFLLSQASSVRIRPTEPAS